MPPSAIPFTGATTLARLTFHCDGHGDSTLSLQQTVLYDVSGEVHHFVENGFVVQQDEHDVAVVDISCSKTVVGQGYPVYVSVTVENQGIFIETFDVNAYARDGWIGVQTVHDLPGGEIMVVTFTWETAGFARGNYAMRAVADDIPYETDTGDNTLIHGRVKVTIQGDVTEDQRLCVDMLDIALLIDWYMTSPPYWDPNCDVNNDLSIDMADIADAIDHFMQSDP